MSVTFYLLNIYRDYGIIGILHAGQFMEEKSPKQSFPNNARNEMIKLQLFLKGTTAVKIGSVNLLLLCKIRAKKKRKRMNGLKCFTNSDTFSFDPALHLY